MSDPTAAAASGAPPRDAGARHATLVGAGIFLSRIAGLVRQRVFSHYFGLHAEADAFNAAFRIPNLLQNLFGEGVLSGSFIPVYSRLLARGHDEEAGRLAGAAFAMLALVVAVIVALGVTAAPMLTDTLAAGFTGETRALTVRLVRVLFPGAGLLVLSAWCLGILNSHRRFFLSYTAPVLWNAVMIGTLAIYGGRYHDRLDRLALALAWGSVIGSALQFLIQLPAVLRLVRHLRVALNRRVAGLREVTASFVPVFVGRGVVQLSAYIDVFIASYLPVGAVSAITNAQTIYLLPVSLFGMAVSAAELPAMAAAHSDDGSAGAYLRERLSKGLRRMAYFVIPSAVACLAIGDVLAGLLFRSGRFGAADARYVWAILAGSAIGLVPATMGRLFSSALYAQRDARSPLRYALIRVGITIGFGYLAALHLPRILGVDARWGAAALTATTAIGAWVESSLLRRAVSRRIGRVPFGWAAQAPLYAAALTAAASAWGARSVLQDDTRLASALAITTVYGAVYLLATLALGAPEARALMQRVARRRGG